MNYRKKTISILMVVAMLIVAATPAAFAAENTVTLAKESGTVAVEPGAEISVTASWTDLDAHRIYTVKWEPSGKATTVKGAESGATTLTTHMTVPAQAAEKAAYFVVSATATANDAAGTITRVSAATGRILYTGRRSGVPWGSAYAVGRAGNSTGDPESYATIPATSGSNSSGLGIEPSTAAEWGSGLADSTDIPVECAPEPAPDRETTSEPVPTGSAESATAVTDWAGNDMEAESAHLGPEDSPTDEVEKVPDEILAATAMPAASDQYIEPSNTDTLNSEDGWHDSWNDVCEESAPNENEAPSGAISTLTDTATNVELVPADEKPAPSKSISPEPAGTPSASSGSGSENLSDNASLNSESTPEATEPSDVLPDSGAHMFALHFAPKESAPAEPSSGQLMTGTEDAWTKPVELRISMSGIPSSLRVIPDQDGGTGSILQSGELGSLSDGITAEELASWIVSPSEGTVRIQDMHGMTVAPNTAICTGMVIQVLFPDGSVAQESTIVVEGDVLGTGELGLTQLVRLAAVYTGQESLEGPFAKAAEAVDGNPGVSLTDIVMLAQKFRGGKLAVEYSVVARDSAEVLEEAGYDLAPWTDQLAVLKADIPGNAKIESIAWTQHDIFPDGREQELYYEGPEKSLVFGAYTEGRTVVTTVVTMESGRTASKETEIAWETADNSAESNVAPDSVSDEEELVAAKQARAAFAGTLGATKEPLSGARAGRPTKTSGTAAQNASPSHGTESSPSASTSASEISKPSATVHPSRAPRPTAGSNTATVALVSTEEQGLLLPTFRAEAFNACNDLRDLNRIRPLLKTSTKLGEAAMVRATEMAARKTLHHTRPDGSKYSTVAKLGHGTVIGENIHSNRGYPVPDIARVAARGWSNSAPHRKQMLEPRYTHTGLGFVMADNGRWYCVQVFSNGDDVISIDTPKV